MKGTTKTINYVIMAALGAVLAAIIISTAQGGLENILTEQIEKSIN